MEKGHTAEGMTGSKPKEDENAVYGAEGSELWWNVSSDKECPVFFSVTLWLADGTHDRDQYSSTGDLTAFLCKLTPVLHQNTFRTTLNGLVSLEGHKSTFCASDFVPFLRRIYRKALMSPLSILYFT